MTTGPQNIALVGQNSSNSLSTIKCQGTSGFEFRRDIQSLNTAYLDFTGYRNVDSGGAISVYSGTITSTNDHYINNSAA